MSNQNYPKERIYLARIIKPHKSSELGEFAIHHSFQPDPSSPEHAFFNYGLTKDVLIGYLEGATTAPTTHIKEILNGLPQHHDSHEFSYVKTNNLSVNDFISIVKEAGLEAKCKAGKIRTQDFE